MRSTKWMARVAVLVVTIILVLEVLDSTAFARPRHGRRQSRRRDYRSTYRARTRHVVRYRRPRYYPPVYHYPPVYYYGGYYGPLYRVYGYYSDGHFRTGGSVYFRIQW